MCAPIIGEDRLTTQIAQTYRNFFGPHAFARRQWQNLQTPSGDFRKLLSERAVDFSYTDAFSWADTAKRIVMLLLKFVIFPWGLYELSRYALQRLVMLPLYPAQSRLIRLIDTYFLSGNNSHENILTIKEDAVHQLRDSNFIVREVTLQKNGTRYQGILVGHSLTINNGHWTVQATGNFEQIEKSLRDISIIHAQSGFNTLMINGPAVSLSEGQATPETMGEAQEIGMRFVEDALHATHVILSGRSIGAGAMAKAIEKHDFKPHIRYAVATEMTFHKISYVAKRIVGRIVPALKDYVEGILKWTDSEIDLLPASAKLSRLGIPEVVIQARETPPFESHFRVMINDGNLIRSAEDVSDDEVIPKESSHAYHLLSLPRPLNHKYFHGIERVDSGQHLHMDDQSINHGVRIAAGLLAR